MREGEGEMCSTNSSNSCSRDGLERGEGEQEGSGGKGERMMAPLLL